MLVGNYIHTLDSKNRVFFPAKHREQLGTIFMVTLSVDNCLSAYSMEEWENYTAKFKALPKTKVREVARFLYAFATEARPDSQGRVQLTKELLDYAGIKDSVTFLGCGEHVELWATGSAPIPVFDQTNGESIEKIKNLMEELDL